MSASLLTHLIERTLAPRPLLLRRRGAAFQSQPMVPAQPESDVPPPLAIADAAGGAPEKASSPPEPSPAGRARSAPLAGVVETALPSTPREAAPPRPLPQPPPVGSNPSAPPGRAPAPVATVGAGFPLAEARAIVPPPAPEPHEGDGGAAAPAIRRPPPPRAQPAAAPAGSAEAGGRPSEPAAALDEPRRPAARPAAAAPAIAAPSVERRATAALPVAALPVATAAPLAATARGGPPQPDWPRPAPAPPLIARPAIGALAIQRANAAPALPAAPAAAPEVHITIGRVDIRAEAPAAARPAPRHSPPPPSLADYLARRDRARR